MIVSSVPSTWFQAKLICQSYGRSLLEIHSAYDNIEAQELLDKYEWDNAWIGADDVAWEDQFHWQNGSKVLQTYWAPASWDGKGGSQDCVAIASIPQHPTNWFDRECENKYPFICQ